MRADREFFVVQYFKLMPVEDIGKGFSPDFGRPTKEHYSICGLILLKDYFGWTNEKTIDKYLYDLQIKYALKLQPVAGSPLVFLHILTLF
jgi:hypothetical protein